MRIAVVGLWHLGIVTAACLTKAGHEIIAYDPNIELIKDLQKGIAPIFEPGLSQLLESGKNNLYYTFNEKELEQAEIIWVNFDTPVNDNDEADIDFVVNEIKKLLPNLQNNSLILISSQLPVGTTKKISHFCDQHYPEKKLRFGYIPENLRLGKAISVFTQPDRFVVGLENPNDKDLIKFLLGLFTENFVWMSIESAEMTKHAINSFLALSVTFINEVASLCEQVGADAREVESGLKSEERIGIKAYLKPGGAIAGGTLLRDINYLNELGLKENHPLPLMNAIIKSNDYHKDWVKRKISEVFADLKLKNIAVLGLTYKVNTNTLRRSSAVETCYWLHQQGAKVSAFDPAITMLPEDYAHFIDLKNNINETLLSADAIVVATEWPDFRKLETINVIENARSPLVIDSNGFLMGTLGNDKRIKYFTVGKVI